MFVAENKDPVKSAAGGQDFRRTKFVVVRYGNVLGSRGSVIPFFKERAATGVLPITDSRMTRFWITLDQAVHFVLESLERSFGGEIFVPRIPSMKIIDLAKAIAPHAKQEIVGIRPGEKLHEILISEDEARNTVMFKDCYVVYPRTISIQSGNGKPCPENFEYTSDANSDWLTVEDLKKLVEQISDDYAIEKSRWTMGDVVNEKRR